MLSNNNIESFTNEQRQQFARKHPSLLGQKHQQTVKSIRDLQEVEKYMFKNLQALNKSSPNSIQESEVIKKRLAELNSMRMTLFTQLKSMYSENQRDVADSRNNLTDQMMTTKIVENELSNAKKELESLKEEKIRKKRLVELGEYEYDRYTSHKNLVKVLTYGALGCLFIVFLMGFNWFPASVGFGAMVLIISVVLITIAGRMINNFSRTNLYWNKFDYSGVEVPTGRDGGPRKWFDFSRLFSTTCKNITDTATDYKNKVLNVTDKAVVKVSQESFNNIVQPSEPSANESFESVF
tara:strand:- start:36 stop:920 length:885 start_codon:yes stop_codon:yes gene_type:complete